MVVWAGVYDLLDEIGHNYRTTLSTSSTEGINLPRCSDDATGHIVVMSQGCPTVDNLIAASAVGYLAR